MDLAGLSKLSEAVKRLAEEAARLQRNLARVHQLQTTLTAVTQQWVEEGGKPTNNDS